MSRSVQKTAQGQAIALAGADMLAEPLTVEIETTATAKRTRKVVKPLTED